MPRPHAVSRASGATFQALLRITRADAPIVTARPRLLYAEDDPAVRSAFARALVRTYDITQCNDGAEAIERLARGEVFDAVLTDLDMPNVGGEGVIAWLDEHDPRLSSRTIVVTAGGRGNATREAWLAAFDRERVLNKPCTLTDIVRAVSRVLGM